MNETIDGNSIGTSTRKQRSSFIQLRNNTRCDPQRAGQTDDPLSSRSLHVWRKQADALAQAQTLLAPTQSVRDSTLQIRSACIPSPLS